MIKKNAIKTEVEKDELFEEHIEDVLKRIEKTAKIESILEFYGKDYYFPAAGDGQWDERKNETTPELWRALYKYSHEYGSYLHSNFSYNTLIDEDILNNPSSKILDFGCGPNPIINYSAQFYLVEINDSSRDILHKTFKDKDNVHIFGLLSEVIKLDIKFDAIHSKDTLEHIRHINENLYALYYLCVDHGSFAFQYPFDGGGGHCYGLFEDSTTRETFLKMGH